MKRSSYKLFLELYGVEEEYCLDSNFLLWYLDELPGLLEMKKAQAPYLVSYKNESGNIRLAGAVIIMESLIVVHTFPDRRFIYVDINSCKRYDPEEAGEFTRYCLEPRSMKKYWSEMQFP